MRILITALFTTLISVIGLNASDMPKWTPDAQLQTKTVSDVQISPDNAWVLFVAAEPKMTEVKGTFFSRIYKGSASGKEPALLFSPEDLSSIHPRWSPTGEWVACITVNEGIRNLSLIRSEGGNAIPLTKEKKDVLSFAWSPDGTKIAFVMEDETEIEKTRNKTSLAYAYQEKRKVNRLWLIDLCWTDLTPKPLTPDDYCIRGCPDFGAISTEFDWSPDSKEIAFAYFPALGFDHFYLDSSLAIVDVATGAVAPWENLELYEALPRFSPDGQWVAYLSSNSAERYAGDRQIAIRSRDGRERRLLAKTSNEGPLGFGPSLLGWKGTDVLFFEPKGTKFHIEVLPLDGKPATELEIGDTFFKVPALSYDRTMLGFVGQTLSTPSEAYVSRLDHFEPVQVSNLNELFLSYPKIKTDLISWESSDGLKIEGLLTYPIHYEYGKRYPLLVVVHGGPMFFFDQTFVGSPYPYPYASFAQEGFFILRANPRGSTGYGKNFRSANYNDWGGMDFIDIMSGVDTLIAKGFADPERMGIMGWSYGGYMTAWTITQTDRFKAASVGAGVTNLVSFNGTSDLHRFLTDYLGEFTANSEFYRERSPINHVSNVKTPCLIQHGTADLRVPTSQGYEFYHALDRLGQKPTLILYPGMGHGFNDPNMFLDAMEWNLAWFKDRLK